MRILLSFQLWLLPQSDERKSGGGRWDLESFIISASLTFHVKEENVDYIRCNNGAAEQLAGVRMR